MEMHVVGVLKCRRWDGPDEVTL